jgi:phage terminase large subunit-like protein
MTSARQLSRQLAERLRGDWHTRARPEQIPPDSPWSICLMLSGRGWGKTRAGADWVRGLAESGVSRIALVGATAADVWDIMVEDESGILACCPADNRPTYEPSKRRITWANGAIATAYSTEESDRLRGPQHAAAWCDEMASWRNAKETFDQLSFGLRLGRTRKR